MSGNPILIPVCAQTRDWTFRDILSLVKGHLSLYIALTAVAGHALARNRFSLASLGLGACVLVLSCGAGVLNNIQDRGYDQRVLRTRNRVLARGDMSPQRALILAVFCILGGLTGLWLCFASSVPCVLGGIAILCYNGVYTPMKKCGTPSRFRAMVPGTLCGMIPPALGWAAVDKGIAVADLSGLYIFMAGLGVWQFPHFLLMLLRENMEDPSLSDVGSTGFWSEKEALHQVIIWVALFSISMMLFLINGWIISNVFAGSLFFLAIGLPLFLAALFWTGPATRRRLDLGFWALNLCMLGYIFLMLLDRV